MSSGNAGDAVEIALRRAAAYTLLAHVFAHPDDDRVAALREAAAEARELAPNVGILRLAILAADLRREAIEPAYVALNTFGTSPNAPLFETAYFGSGPQQQTQRMADIAGFYRAFGVESVGGDLRPDDLPVELEFMAFLCRKEAYAIEHSGAPRVAQVRRAQRLFLAEHLGRWAPVVGNKISTLEEPGPFYRLCGETLAAWVSRECQDSGVEAMPVSGEVATDWREPVSHGPEFASEPAFAGGTSFVALEELAVR